MLQELNTFLTELKDLRRSIGAERTKTINKVVIRRKADTLASKWLSEYGTRIEADGHIAPDVIKKYSNSFRQLLRISGPSNRKVTYVKLLNELIKPFREEIILKLYEQLPTSPSLALLSTLFKGLPSDEHDYLREAIGCAQKGFLRASLVLGWCAAIDRIHRKIEEIGFPAFNVASAQMASQQKGRFKRFNQVQNISSLTELREVFDNIVLWIIEGMELIDSNQHTRLRSCFDMRCQSAHPGDAPITEFNLLSFFSDLKEIVFGNPKFALNQGVTNPAKALTTQSTGP